MKMKLIIIFTTLALCQGAKLDRTYLPPGASNSGGGGFLETPKQSGPNDANIPFGVSANMQNLGASYRPFGQSQNFAELNQNSQNFNDIQAENVDSGFANTANGKYKNSEEQRPERPQSALERNAATLREENENNGDSFSYLFETENGIFAEESGVATNGVQAQGGYSYTGDDGQVYSITYTADENGFVPHGDHIPTAPPVPEEILRALVQNAADEAAGIFDDGSYNERKYGGPETLGQSQQYNHDNSGNAQGADAFDDFSQEFDAVTQFASEANLFSPQGARNSAAYLPPNQATLSPSAKLQQPQSVPSNQNAFNINADAKTRATQNAAYISPGSDHARAFMKTPFKNQPITLNSEVPNGLNNPNFAQSVAHLPPPQGSRQGQGQSLSSYEVPISSAEPSANGFGSRENFNGRPARPSFNSRTGYKY